MQMLKSDNLGYYNVELDDETGEVIFDPRAPVIPKVKVEEEKPVQSKPKG